MKNSINIAKKVINNEIDALKKLLPRLDNNFEKISTYNFKLFGKSNRYWCWEIRTCRQKNFINFFQYRYTLLFFASIRGDAW